MNRVLVDTHCHVHVSLHGGAETAQSGCCTNEGGGQQHVSSTGTEDVDGLVGDEVDNSSVHDGKSRLASVPLPKVVHITMGIKEDDWAGAVHFAANHALVGAHLRSAHSRSEGWLRDLTALLEEHPRALVGEIGLDKVARTPDTRRVEWDHQLEVFRAQMALAARLNRPVSVHCVKAYGKIVDCLKDATGASKSKRPSTGSGGGGAEGGGGCSSSNTGGSHGCRVGSTGNDGGVDGVGGVGDGLPKHGAGRNLERAGIKTDTEERHRPLPPRIALHSFTGAVEVAKDITRLGGGGREGGVDVYFGFSAAVNMRGDRETRRLVDVLRVVPDSRVLIETDRQAPATSTSAAEELLRVCATIAEAKGVSIEEACALADKNSSRFLGEVGNAR